MGVIIEHRKRTVSEGYSVLFWIAITVVGLGVFQCFLFPWIWTQDRLFVIASITIELVVVAFAIHYAKVNIRASDTFICRMDDNQITCVCPVPDCGESFSLPIKTIVRIDREETGECGYRWYLWDASGHRFWLTTNYDNPVERFLDAIRDRNPGIAECRK